MPTGRIPLGNGSGRAAILPSKEGLAFLWSMANQGPSRAVCRQVRQEAPASCSISGLAETGPEQEWSNGTEFSGYSDFPEF